MNHLTAHTFQRDFTYIISFESYRILWARQGRNHNLHVREELRASYGHVVGEWLGQIHMVFWPRVECPNDLYVHVHVLIISPWLSSISPFFILFPNEKHNIINHKNNIHPP